MASNALLNLKKSLGPAGRISKREEVDLNSKGRDFHNACATTKKALFIAAIPLTSLHGGTTNNLFPLLCLRSDMGLLISMRVKQYE